MNDNNDSKYKDNLEENIEEIEETDKDFEKEVKALSSSVSATSGGDSEKTKTPSPRILPDVMDSPFLLLENINEDINLVTGELSYLTTDLHLPGKNGMDLVIQRKYNAHDSNDKNLHTRKKSREKLWYWRVIYQRTREEISKSYPYLSESACWSACWTGLSNAQYWAPSSHDIDYYTVKVDPEIKSNYHTITSINEFNRDYCGIGDGWRFNFPSIESKPCLNDDRTKYYKMLHMDDGRTYKIANSEYEDGDKDKDEDSPNLDPEYASGLTNPLQDVVVKKDGDYYIATTKEGRKMLFKLIGNEQYVLSYMEDKFGNRISFGYGGNAGNRLAYIIDTYGRRFDFVYKIENNARINEWINTETKMVEFRYTSSYDGTELKYATDKLGRTTSYTYAKQSVGNQLYTDILGDEAQEITYTNLTKINYYNGLETEYTYNVLTTFPAGNIDPHFRVPSNRFVIVHRKDKYISGEYNKSWYEYGINPGTEPDRGYGGIEGGFVDTTIHTTEALRTIFTFDRDGLCTNEKVYNGNILLKEILTKHKREATSRFLPERIETKIYFKDVTDENKTLFSCSEHVVTNKYYEDYKGNIREKETRVGTPMESADGMRYIYRQTEKYEYDNRYNMLTLKSYMKDDNTEVVEKHTLDAEGKIGTSKEICENGKTSYKEEYKYKDNNLTKLISKTAGESETLTQEFEYGARTYEPSKIMSYTGVRYDPEPRPPYNEVLNGSKTQNIKYDWYGRKTDIDKPEVIKYTLDKVGRILEEKYANNTSKQFKYNDATITVTVTDEKGRDMEYQYDPFGNILNVTDKSIGLTTVAYEYDTMQNLKFAQVFLSNNIEKATIAPKYDHYGRVIEKKISGLERTTNTITEYIETTEYNDVGDEYYNSETLTVKGNETLPNMVTTIYRDHLGNTLKEKYFVNGQKCESVYTYDKIGNEVTFRNDIDRRGRQNTTTKITNAIGQVTNIYYSGNNTSEFFTYHSTGKVLEHTDRKGNTTRYDYDAMGNVISETNPVGAEKTYEYNNNGHLMKVTHPKNSKDGSNPYTDYNYDIRGRLKEEKHNGSKLASVKYDYDKTGNQIEMSVLYQNGGYVTTRKDYDIRGNLIKIINPNGQIKNFVYDTNNRVISSTDLNGNVTTFKYDSFDRIIEAVVREPSGKALTTNTVYDKIGRVSSVQNETLKTTYTYNTIGGIIKAVDSDGNIKDYTYDALGRRANFKLTALGAQQFNLTYEYDRMSQLIEVCNNSIPLTGYAYDKNGNRELVKHANGSSTSYVYDKCNRIDTLVSKNNNTVLESLKHNYNDDSSMKSILKQGKPFKKYTYDLLGRLVEEHDQDDDKKKRTRYTYDDAGNRTEANVYYDNLGSQVFEKTTYNYNNLFQLTKDQTEFDKSHPDEDIKDSTEVRTYKYDLNGNQTEMECETLYRRKNGTSRSKPRVTIAGLADEEIEIIELREYNGKNQLIKVYKDGKNIIYSYKPDGMRYSKTIDDIRTTHVWDGQNIVLDISGNNRVKGRYLRGSSLSSRIQDNQTHYYLHNAHGDVVYLIDQNYNMIKHYDYSAFGIENKSEKNDSNTFRYCGEYYDGEIKNIYLRARYYSQRTGRFTSEDPAMDGSNWYSYCYGDPVQLIDTDGMYPLPHDDVYGNGSSGSGRGNPSEAKIKPRSMSAKGAEFTTRAEGFHPTWMDVGDGLRTIGFGHTYVEGDYEKIGPEGFMISEEAAITLFQEDVNTRYGPELNTFIETYNVELEQHQYDALLCFVYQQGGADVLRSDKFAITKLLKSGDWTPDQISEEFTRFLGYKGEETDTPDQQNGMRMGLWKRQMNTGTLFADGDYTYRELDALDKMGYRWTNGAVGNYRSTFKY